MDDEEAPQLSAAALAALEEIYGKDWRNSVGKKETPAEQPAEPPGEDEDGFVSEDWGLSQFWYSEETSSALAEEALEVSDGGPVCCISSPSAFRALRRMRKAGAPMYVLEYDKRFGRYGEAFAFYDYNAPQKVPEHLKGTMRVIVADPPYLSEECQTKVAESVRLLAASLDPEDPRRTRVIWNTGRVMGPTIARAIPGMRRSAFRPQHARNLSNDFACFTNYASQRFGVAPDDP
eukprot:tig00000480_g1316.t1